MNTKISIERTIGVLIRRVFKGNECRRVINKNDKFSLKSGPFYDAYVLMDMYYVEPNRWWTCYGLSAHLLYSLMLRVLG